jgi:hypothetical protein
MIRRTRYDIIGVPVHCKLCHVSRNVAHSTVVVQCACATVGVRRPCDVHCVVFAALQLLIWVWLTCTMPRCRISLATLDMLSGVRIDCCRRLIR